MTDAERLEILAVAQDRGLSGMGGACGETAIAINHLLFSGGGTLVAAVNRPLWQRGYLVGHVGVCVGGSIWDAEGAFDTPDDWEDFRGWGMVDPDDYTLTEEEAYDAEIVSVSEKQVRALLPACGRKDPWALLRQARAQVMRR